MPGVSTQCLHLDDLFGGNFQRSLLKIPDHERGDANNDQHDLCQFSQPEYDEQDRKDGHGRHERKAGHQGRKCGTNQGDGAVPYPYHKGNQGTDPDPNGQTLEAGHCVVKHQVVTGALTGLKRHPLDGLHKCIQRRQQFVIGVLCQAGIGCQHVDDEKQHKRQHPQGPASSVGWSAIDKFLHGVSLVRRQMARQRQRPAPCVPACRADASLQLPFGGHGHIVRDESQFDVALVAINSRRRFDANKAGIRGPFTQ